MMIEYMEITISKNSLVEEVQKVFSEFFPYLRLNFLPINKLSASPKALPKSLNIKPLLKFGDLNNNLLTGRVDLSDTTTVTEVVNIFRSRFGINVQVLRKSGNIWLEASMTGNWSLGQQNEHGREISAVKQ